MNKSLITLNSLKIVIMLGMFMLILLGIKIAADIIVPFILALFITLILNPLVQLLVQLCIPRVLAIIIIIATIVIVAMLLVTYLGTSLNELTHILPEYSSFLVLPLLHLQSWFQHVGITVSIDELIKNIDYNTVITLITGLLTQLSNTMSSMFLLLLTVVFMLLEAPQLPKKLKQFMIYPTEGMETIQRVLDSVSRYLVLKTLISLTTGLIIWSMLVVLNVRFALIWGVLAFLLNYIPNIGSVLAAIPPIIQVLMFSGLYHALIVLISYLMISLIFGNVLEPRIMGHGLGLSTLVIFLSLIFWGWLLGLVGMLLSIPLTIITKIALEQTKNGQRIAVLLSDMSNQK